MSRSVTPQPNQPDNMFLVISSSLSPQSRSRVLANHAAHALKSLGNECHFVDLAELKLPRCDADSCYAAPAARQISELVKSASGIVLATPVYNYSIGSEAKNMVELTGQAWKEKVAGFLCAAGGQGSYMSIMQLANSLMLDFRTFVLPRFVYATGQAFTDNEISDPDLQDRIDQFASEMSSVTHALVNRD